MSSCAMRSCCSRQGVDKKKSSGITFHRFPKNSIRREAWVNFVNRRGWQATKSCVLCSKHFSKECFDRTSQCVVRLKPDAVPSLDEGFIEVKPTPNIIEAVPSTSSHCEARGQQESFKSIKVRRLSDLTMKPNVNVTDPLSASSKDFNIQACIIQLATPMSVPTTVITPSSASSKMNVTTPLRSLKYSTVSTTDFSSAKKMKTCE